MKVKANPKAIVVGAGICGLSAAIELENLGFDVEIHEGSNTIGGRIQSDDVGGFILDHGYQVLLTSYPQLEALNISKELQLKSYQSGARCFLKGRFVDLYNPLQSLKLSLKSLFKMPFYLTSDLVKLGYHLKFSEAKGSTQDWLNQASISNLTINNFIRPFFGGVFLEEELCTHSSLFIEYMNYFIKGDATLPKGGMRDLPKLLLKRLRRAQLFLNHKVVAVDPFKITLQNEQTCVADCIILALDRPNLCKLYPEIPRGRSNEVTTFYYK